MIPGMSPKQMKNMQRQMKKMGMDMKEIEGVQEVIIRCDDKDLIMELQLKLKRKLKFQKKTLKWLLTLLV